MSTKNFTDRFGQTIELTSERWHHVIDRHQELRLLEPCIAETLHQPDAIVRSIYDAQVKLYYKFFPELWGGKYVVVVIRLNHRHQILTVYVTDKIKGGERLWPSG